MKSRLFLTAIFFMAVLCVSAAPAFAWKGYDWNANIFVGTGEQWAMEKFGWSHGVAEAYMYPYHHDKLVMKWNDEWNRGNAEGWNNPPYDAWLDNEWNGRCVRDGSGEVWHYKIKWIGSGHGADGTFLPDGGYVIWGQFEVILDHGSWSDHTHEFLAHAIPCGYGAP